MLLLVDSRFVVLADLFLVEGRASFGNVRLVLCKVDVRTA
jgi:hypothetical protein